MNRRQFFGAVAGGAVVSQLPEPADPLPVSGVSIAREAEYAAAFDASVSRFDLLYGASSIKSEFAMLVVGGEDDPDDLEGWEVVEDEPEVYVSPRVEAADRLFHLQRAALGKENA